MDYADSSVDAAPLAPTTTDADTVSSEEGNAYAAALELELAQLNALSTEGFSNIRRIITDILDRQKNPNAEPDFLSVDEGNPVPIKLIKKVFIPTTQYPNFNFVGKLLGPGGSHLKQLVKTTNCRMFILGRGSTKDKDKEEELRNSGDPKYQHLGEPLHVRIETFAPAPIAYQQLSHAISVISRVMRPVQEDNSSWLGYEMSGYGGYPPMRGRGGYGPPPPFFGGPPLPMRGFNRGGRSRGYGGGYQRRGFSSPRGGGSNSSSSEHQQPCVETPAPVSDCPDTTYSSYPTSDQAAADPGTNYAADAGLNGGGGDFYSQCGGGDSAGDSSTFQDYGEENGGGKAPTSVGYDRPSPY